MDLEDTFDEGAHIILETNSGFQSLSEKTPSLLDFAPTEPSTPFPERRVNTEKTRIFHVCSNVGKTSHDQILVGILSVLIFIIMSLLFVFGVK